ncbi:MAG: RusA family crossover junction endodeoxyribonuclease [Planctomycetes bacterium]|nr:RusA family crossover junction endodeoxyribonuclease [Planctomycetota bacterium]
MSDRLELRIPFTPCSKKNSLRRITVKGRPLVAPSRAAKAEQQAIRTIALQAVLAARLPLVPFGEDEVSVLVERLVDEDAVRVQVVRLHPKPARGRTGRDRDTQNLAESILDACNGVLWKDDRQVGEIHIRRVLGEGARSCS